MAKSDDQKTDENADFDAPTMEEMQAFSANLLRVATRSQELVSDFLTRHSASAPGEPNLDPLNIGSAFLDMTHRMLSNPASLAENQMALWQDYLRLWQTATLRMMGEKAEPVIEPERGDKRFKHPDWTENQIFDFIKQSYLLASKYVNKSVNEVEGLSKEDAKKVDFYTRQTIDALSPSNFVMTNPEVLRATLDQKGENLVRGLENMLEDLERGEGQLAIKMTDLDAFEVGKNVAITPGKVVFENKLFQLIQYTPMTETVYQTPLLIFPPWINKFYILDLTEQKSFVRWCLEQGITVFMVSWANPDSSFAELVLDDYLELGMLSAIDAVLEITGEPATHAIGYCVAGTMLAATLAYLEAKGQGDKVKSATFFTAQVDFSESGELKMFVDDEQIDAIDSLMKEKGYLDSKNMALTFNLLRSNDLIWSFVVNNYLLGKEPFPFDLLYWNSDSTHLPRALHRQYLEQMYRDNALVEPGRIILKDVPIDLTTIKTPAYIQAGIQDHIAPPESVYKMTKILSGPIKFVLAGSGHIAGVVNPPAANKYQYWTNSKKAASLAEWVEGSKETPGSWWPDWIKWLSRKSGKKIPALKPGQGKFKAIEDAPGRYVKKRD